MPPRVFPSAGDGTSFTAARAATAAAAVASVLEEDRGEEATKDNDGREGDRSVQSAISSVSGILEREVSAAAAAAPTGNADPGSDTAAVVAREGEAEQVSFSRARDRMWDRIRDRMQ